MCGQRMSPLSDLRRLYHHVHHGGTWDREVDTRRLGTAIARIERLESYLLSLAQHTPHAWVKDEINELLNVV